MAPNTRAIQRTPSAVAIRTSLASTQPIGERAARGKHSVGRSTAKQFLTARRQASIRQPPPPRKVGSVVPKVPTPRLQPSINQPQPAPREPVAQNVPDLPVHLPQELRPPPIRPQSLERYISPPPLLRGTKRKRPARRPPSVRRGNSLAWEAREGSPPADSEDAARIMYRERDLPVAMDEAPPIERRLLRNASNDGMLPHEFSSSQLAWASIIARVKPPRMEMSHFIARLLKRTGNENKVASDRQLGFNSLDYVKDMLLESHEKNLELAAKYEKERIERKRAERALRQATSGAQVPNLTGDATQLLNDHQREVDGQVGVANEYPNIEEANVVAAQPERQNIPVICYLLLRQSRALHALLSDQTVSPTRLTARILQAIQLIREVIESTTSHSPTHFSRADLRQTFQIASSVFGICLRGLQHLCRDIPGRQQKGQVIYDLCNIFKAGLKHNEELCMKVAKEAYEIARGNLSLAQRLVLSSLELHDVEIPCLLSCRTEFLAAIFLSKEVATMPKPTCYTAVLEGLSAELYNKIGTLVSETVFGEQVAASNLLSHMSHIPPDGSSDEVRDLAVAVERDQVLKLLRIVVRRLCSTAGDGAGGGDGGRNSPAHHLAQLISTDKLLTGSNDSRERLFEIAKERLQHTLCKAIFGEDDGEYRTALKEMRWGGQRGAEHHNAAGQEVVINDEGEKFVEGIWEMVGWDILEGI